MGVAAKAKNLAPEWAKEAVRPAFRLAGQATSRLRPFPDYLIIGTKRGGTTSMYKYLLRHPNVVPMWPGVENAKKTHFFDQNFDRGELWYRAHFPTSMQRSRVARRTGAPALSGEAAPYYSFHPLVADRVHRTIPDVKVLMLVRNPVDRIWSHHHERVYNGTEPLPFREALEAEDERLAGEYDRIVGEPGYYSERHDFCSYLARGRYLEHLEPWLERFPAEQVHIVRSEDLYRDANSALDAAFEFLGLPQTAPLIPHRFNEIRSSKMPADERERLAEYYAPHVDALQERLDRDFGWDLVNGGLLSDRARA